VKGLRVRIAGCAILAVLSCTAMAAGSAVDLDNAVVTVSEADRTLYVDGVFGPKFEPDVRAAIEQSPRLQRVVLRSPGGMRAPAMRVADLFNRRGMTVRVEGRCASACVLLFASARSREMTADSKIGLHRSSLDPDLPIPDTLRQQLMERNDRETDEVLRKGGFSTRVIAMGAATPPTTMTWFTPGELRVEGLPFVLLEPRIVQARSETAALPAPATAGVHSASLAAPR
jgi:hypothetical protein